MTKSSSKACTWAQDDAERGLLDNERMQRVRDAVAEIVDDLGTHEDKDDVLT